MESKQLNKTPIRKSVILTLVKLCIIFSFTPETTAQYITLKPQQDIKILGSMAVYSGLNFWISTKINHTNQSGHSWQVPLIDNLAPHNLNANWSIASDGMALGTVAAAGLITFALPKDLQKAYMMVGIQNLWITANLTQTIKVLAARNRPYTQTNGFVFTKADDHYSFFSGHTAITATIATTAIMTALNQNAMPRWAVGSSYAAGALCIGTAAMRIAAGKHYPSDVVTGLLIGVGTAIINTRYHAKN